ncbi:SRPBCC family protein [Rhizobium sp. YJ-22]|uniref:SRPBCC family protein n=1 Tax=Rhizobium sp. YJ-22 TaxID=3037556 RepID=UPI002412D51B|nr:SRPBCC family protein [Rhizobium sp. YJ-22]MDG3575758.1 SRPBCC family protein [Rhizobium sp. YJ-22]
MSTYPAHIVHLSIDRPWNEVYRFAADPLRMPRWATGLGAGIRRSGEDWVVDGGPIGEVRVRFAIDNAFGVIDHAVTLPDGTMVHNALRIVPNGDGAEAMFMLLKLPGTDDTAFEADARNVMADLKRLKELLEAGAN